MNDGSPVKLLQICLQGHGNRIRIHGSLGLMENLRHTDQRMPRVRKEPSGLKKGEVMEEIYTPRFPRFRGEPVRAGDGGGDFFVLLEFAEAIRSRKQPYFDVYRGVALSVAGILGYRSALADSAGFGIPDFRRTEVLEHYAADDWSPDPSKRAEGQPWSSIFGDLEPSAKAKAHARRIWRQMGREGE